MENMKKDINKKDLILGLAMICLSVYILFSGDVITGNSIFKEEILVGKADFYIKFFAGILMIVSIALIVKALGLFGLKPTPVTKEPVNHVVVLSFIAMFIYLLIIRSVGFFIASFLLITTMSFVIRLKEDKIDLTDKKSVLKTLVISAIFSIIMVSITLLIFEKLLKVQIS